MTHAELWERHKAVMPDWLALYYEEPIEIVKGSGRRVTDGEGKEYIDFFAGILTNAIGYDIAGMARYEQGAFVYHDPAPSPLPQYPPCALKVSVEHGKLTITDRATPDAPASCRAECGALEYSSAWTGAARSATWTG